jgi:hypothetical protein
MYLPAAAQAFAFAYHCLLLQAGKGLLFLWDIENVPKPSNMSLAAAVQHIRDSVSSSSNGCQCPCGDYHGDNDLGFYIACTNGHNGVKKTDADALKGAGVKMLWVGSDGQKKLHEAEKALNEVMVMTSHSIGILQAIVMHTTKWLY